MNAKLAKDGLTCVITGKDGKILFSSRERGILPLINAIDSGADFSGAYAYDIIVGKAAALLYAAIGVKKVSCKVLSKAGKEVFCKYGIEFEAETQTDKIINRKGDGICPMEEAVLNVIYPQEAIAAVREKLKKL